MEKKKDKDCQRKNSLEFKKRRNQLQTKRIHGISRKEKQEGKTYETNVGLNIDQTTGPTAIDHQIKEISRLFDDHISVETLKSYEGAVSPFTLRPVCPASYFTTLLYMTQKQILQAKLPSCVNCQLSTNLVIIRFQSIFCPQKTLTNMLQE
jgi:hypothetical protein